MGWVSVLPLGRVVAWNYSKITRCISSLMINEKRQDFAWSLTLQPAEWR